MSQGGNHLRRGRVLAQAGYLRPAPLWLFAGWTPFASIGAAWTTEVEERRLFLWLPVAAGAGVLLYLAADTEPALWLPLLLLGSFSVAAVLSRRQRTSFNIFLILAFVMFGFLCGELRTLRVAAPVLDRIRIARLDGHVEEIDRRRIGARFLLRIDRATDSAGMPLPADVTPLHVRLSMRKAPNFEAGSPVRLLARLLPPARASIPGGYDFARTAFFSGLGAVGSVLGGVEVLSDTTSPGWNSRFLTYLDRQRNQLAERVDTIIGGDEGAIAAAMVTGKRTLLSEDALELIREAGIFHIITISGVQMTLVAGMIFWFVRRLLSLSDVLALRFPIKKIAAVIAIAGAILYDLATGSRVGTERALYMTIIMLGAVLFDRQGFTMRNLAYAVLMIVILEPEAITGASFQLSFSAVAALIAVHESRMQSNFRQNVAAEVGVGEARPSRAPPPVEVSTMVGGVVRAFEVVTRHISHLLVSTFCATLATASFMATDFHDLSPYVLIGNPLTLAIIEFFAVPGALIGSLLYPLGLDAPVWAYVGIGIRFVLWAARLIGSAPGSTLHLHAFAPWTLPFLALGVANAVIWRSWLLRMMSLPLAAIGLFGAAYGAHFDLVVPPTGDSLAMRAPDGTLRIVGKRPSAFAAEQWLAADADGRTVNDARSTTQLCDKLGCIDHAPTGESISIITNPAAFEEDCFRAQIIVSSLEAPESCQAGLIFDRKKLTQTGAVTLAYGKLGEFTSERQILMDRPWSPRIPTDAAIRVAPVIISKQALGRTTPGGYVSLHPAKNSPNINPPAKINDTEINDNELNDLIDGAAPNEGTP